jgi:ligand-binding SRPBCC domain-containing protein
MLHFTHSSIINAPVEVVWKFHERHDVLQLLTPPWKPVQVLRREGGLDEGPITEFRLFLGLLPLTWLARHTDYIIKNIVCLLMNKYLVLLSLGYIVMSLQIKMERRN